MSENVQVRNRTWDFYLEVTLSVQPRPYPENNFGGVLIRDLLGPKFSGPDSMIAVSAQPEVRIKLLLRVQTGLKEGKNPSPGPARPEVRIKFSVRVRPETKYKILARAANLKNKFLVNG